MITAVGYVGVFASARPLKVAGSDWKDLYRGPDYEPSGCQMIGKLLEVSQKLNELAESVEQVSDLEERKRIRRPVGQLMGLVYTDLIVPIITEYPDLDPDKRR
jgi:hypothetical protein